MGEEGPRGKADILTTLGPVPGPIKISFTMMSRGLLSRRHCAGQGHLPWNPEPEVSCFRIRGVVTLGLDLGVGETVQKPWPPSHTRQCTATGQIPPLRSNVSGNCCT